MKYIIPFLFPLASTISFAADKIFVFAQINESILQAERAEMYEEPLNEFLQSKNIGEVTGGGSMLSKSKEIEWVGVDIEIVNPQRNIPIFIKKLKELGAPKGSYLECKLNDRDYEAAIG